MKRRDFVAATLALAMPVPAIARTGKDAMKPPVAPVRPTRTTVMGITLDDPYHWLRDPKYPTVDVPEILDYLKAENAYFEAQMAPAAALRDTIFEELKGRVEESDTAYPWPDGDYLYWWAYAPGSQYRNWYRRPKAGGAEQLLLSETEEAKGKEYFRLGQVRVSPDGRLAAWAADTNGSERFVLKIRDLATGRDLETVAADSLGDIAWNTASDALVWAQASAEWRAKKVFVHQTGGQSTLIYDEPNEQFIVDIGKTQDGRFITLTSGQQVTTEVRLLDAADVAAPPRLIRPARDGVIYSVDSRGDTLFVLANDEHVNFRLATAPLAAPDRWTTLIVGSDTVYLRGVTAFTSYLAIEERLDGLDQVRLRFPDGRERRIAFPEPSYTVSLGTNKEADAPELRLSYSSMVTPQTTFDYDVAHATLISRKVQKIPSGYDPSLYETVRLYAPSRDGVRIPVSVVYKKGYRRDGSQPLHVYGYGAYGIAMPPAFSANRLSLLDRGFAYAIAHIRGGDDMGYQWYLDGKLDKRANPFNDFVDVTRYLNAQGFSRNGQNSASGGSAGGWLMGAVVNQAPDLWRAVVAHVPFVDIVHTMLDESLPLTPGEWPEWGDPRTDKVVLQRLIDLSPYEQTVARAYPAMLITGGLNDPRVTYWEPAKWTARLRAVKTDDNLLLMKINMGAGHGGKSGRFDRLMEVAEEYSFILMAFDGRAKQ